MAYERENLLLFNGSEHPVYFDFYSPSEKAPLVIFVHGFKGFKDWGPFPYLHHFFLEKGFAFCKFNFSHNGVSFQHPTEFVNLKAFGDNTFSKELWDLELLLSYLQVDPALLKYYDTERIYLLGHSRGGGIVLIYANQDPKIKKVVTWAATSNFAWSWTEERIRRWKEEGVIYVENARTKQQMPLNYSLYLDWETNKEKYNVIEQVKKLEIPLLLVHGSADQVVPVSAAVELKNASKNAELYIVEGAGHTFEVKHPMTLEEFSPNLLQTLQYTLTFLA